MKINDFVRLSKFRQQFDKGYVPQYTEEIFKVYKILNRKPKIVYCLTDLDGEKIEGTFYEKELQKINYNSDKPFKIEHILKKRKLRNGKTELFVKWWGYPEKFNCWITEDDII
mgnify:FL=1